MASAAGIILIAGGVTLANDFLNPPLMAPKGTPPTINWRVIPAVAIAAMILSAVDQVNHTLGVGLAVSILISTLVLPHKDSDGNESYPLGTFSHFLGYN